MLQTNTPIPFLTGDSQTFLDKLVLFGGVRHCAPPFVSVGKSFQGIRIQMKLKNIPTGKIKCLV